MQGITIPSSRTGDFFFVLVFRDDTKEFRASFSARTISTYKLIVKISIYHHFTDNPFCLFLLLYT